MSEPTGTTRRTVLGGAGIAAGLGLAAPAPAAGSSGTGAIATGRSGETAVEFRGRISQSGDAGNTFKSYGFLIAVAGLTQDDLFAGPPAVGTALLTAYAEGNLTSRVLDMSVHALDIVGELTVRRRSGPGAAFSDPGSFTTGDVLAQYDLTLQDVLAVFAPARGLPTLTGEMQQTTAGRFGRRGTFGTPGTVLRMFATGLGSLTDPVTLNAELEIAGAWSVP